MSSRAERIAGRSLAEATWKVWKGSASAVASCTDATLARVAAGLNMHCPPKRPAESLSLPGGVPASSSQARIFRVQGLG